MSVIDQINDVLIKENINNNELISKSREIERLMRLKVPSGSLKKGEVCRPIIAIDFASKLLQISISKTSLMSYAPVGKKIYNDTFLACKMLLNLTLPNSITIENLSLKYGHERLIRPANSLLHTFLKKTTTSNLQEHILHAVAFFVSAKNHQVYITKQKYLLDNDLNPVEFKRIFDEFEIRLKAKEIDFNYEGEYDFSLPQPNRNNNNNNNNKNSDILTEINDSIISTELIEQTENHNNIVNPPLVHHLDSNNNTNTNNTNNKYRSVNSKRVFESMNIYPTSSSSSSSFSSLSCSSSISHEEIATIKRKQVTEQVYELWKKEVQEKINQKNQKL